MKSNTSSGFDDISPRIVTAVENTLTIPLLFIFNLSVQQGVFPDKLKIAKVTPIFKSGSKESANNYRPISVLPCFSKLFERIIHSRLHGFLLINKILYSQQFGFQKNNSPEYALMQMVNFIQNSFNQNEFAIGVFIDLSKAFDTVDHSILIKKLSHYGIRGNFLNWFKSYLCNRSQYIATDDSNTDYQTITCGVPQGSILGPLLFLIFINDLHKASSLNSIIFADDTSLFKSHKNIHTLFDLVNQELNKINDWFQCNKLSLNITKTKYILFHKPSFKNKLPNRMPFLKINSNLISQERCLKFLGILINEHLTWKDHIFDIENKISKSIGVMYRASKLLNFKSLKNLYFSFVHSYLNYANIIWGSTYQTHLNSLHLRQKHAVRIVFHKDRLEHSRPLMKEIKALNIFQLNLYQVLFFMYKVKYGVVPGILQREFSPVNHIYRTRNSLNNFQLLYSRAPRFSILSRGPTLWNNILNDYDKSVVSLTHFKNTIKAKLLNLDNELLYFKS